MHFARILMAAFSPTGVQPGFKVFSAICILGLEFAHSDPGFLVRSNAAFGWIALFSLPHQNL
ncbi:hypothetical protein, partial [Aeromonas caviae]|uniref:hypothetical protein n=1 Tax=Aeromonas caviae TaxID=648 RepID=UPI001CC745C1